MKKNNKTAVSILMVLAIFLPACKKTCSVQEYIQWAGKEENGLAQFESYNDIEFKAKYIPAELQCLLQNKALLEEPEKSGTICEDYRRQIYFTFDMYVKNGEQKASIFTTAKNDTEYADLNRYLLESQSRFKLLLGKDTLYPGYFQLERTYELTPYNTIHLAFTLPPSVTGLESMKLLYEEEWFNQGRMPFSWNEEIINDIPELKL